MAQMLDANTTYDITMTLQVPSRGIAQDHRGVLPSGPSRSVDQVVDEFRRECAKQMGVHVSQTRVLGCRFSPRR